MSFAVCKAGLQDCPYAEKDRCRHCGKDRRKRPAHDSRPRERTGRVDRRQKAAYRDGPPEYLVPRTIGVDGEGGDGRYFLLAAADENGAHWEAWNSKGLHTRQCLNFLVNLPGEAVLWGFAFNYDVNMMLVDIPVEGLRRLRNTTHLRWREFRIEWIPNKKFHVSKWRMDGLRQVERIGACTVWDMYPWQQCSFVSWLERNKIAPESEIESIAAMKGKRRGFTVEMQDEILRYCLDECRLLAKGARQLHELLKGQGIRIFQYYSPATASKFLMQEHEVLQHHPGKLGMRKTIHLSDLPFERIFQAAYFGGRAETSLVGPVDGPLYQYDIRSAYPYAATLVPCWRHGEWRSGAKQPIHPWSMLFVRWKPLLKRDRREPMLWGPLPVRPAIGSLRWPTHGKGWYWGTEVMQVQHLAQVKIVRHLRWYQECSCQPFDYLQTLYTERRKLIAANDERQFINKLALNATYGALAQHPPRNNEQRLPRWRNIGWAGFITAHTRGMVASLLDDDAILVATDAVITRRRLAVPVGTKLGDWELQERGDGFMIGPGVYFMQNAEGEWKIFKSRGYTFGSLTYETAMQAWKEDGRNGSVDIPRSIFLGLGAALHRINGVTGDPFVQLWRTFIDETAKRRLTLEPRREWRSDDPWDGTSNSPSQDYVLQHIKRDAAHLAALRALLYMTPLPPYKQLQISEELMELERHQSLFSDGEMNA